MPHPPVTDVALTLLGTGTSVGVPMVGCRCPVCTSDDPRNHRMRSGVAVRWRVRDDDRCLVVDTSPELRLQLLRAEIDHVDAALFTHAHADHIMGLDDLRLCSLRATGALPLYAEPPVREALERTFPYAFVAPRRGAHSGAVPQYEFHDVSTVPLSVRGLPVQPLRLWHGDLPVLGYRFGDVAFCTDCSRVDDATWPQLAGVRVLILDALRYERHPTHFNVEQALEVIAKVGPERAYLTHMAHNLDHETLQSELPDHVEPAFDGLTIAVKYDATQSEAASGGGSESFPRLPEPTQPSLEGDQTERSDQRLVTWIEAMLWAERRRQASAAVGLALQAMQEAASGGRLSVAEELHTRLIHSSPHHAAARFPSAAEALRDADFARLVAAASRRVPFEEAERWVERLPPDDRQLPADVTGRPVGSPWLSHLPTVPDA